MADLILRGENDLKQFDHTVLISWDRKKCRFDEKRPFLLDCSGRAEIITPVTKEITSSGMSIVTVRQEALDFNFETVKFKVGFDTKPANYTHYFTAFPFNRANCRAQ